MRIRNLLVAASVLALIGGEAQAAAVLTAAGAADFTLSTFADQFPITSVPCCGPLGIAFPTTGGVMVADYPGNVRVFATDTDNQHASAGVIGQNYGSQKWCGLGFFRG